MKYACRPQAISMGEISARQAGAMPFSTGPVMSGFVPRSLAPLRTRCTAFWIFSKLYPLVSPTTT